MFTAALHTDLKAPWPASVLTSLPASSPASPLSLTASHGSPALAHGPWRFQSPQKDCGMAHHHTERRASPSGPVRRFGCTPACIHTDAQPSWDWLGVPGALLACRRDSRPLCSHHPPASSQPYLFRVTCYPESFASMLCRQSARVPSVLPAASSCPNDLGGRAGQPVEPRVRSPLGCCCSHPQGQGSPSKVISR